MSRLERLTVQVAPDVRAEIETAARREEISAAAIMRQALRDWAAPAGCGSAMSALDSEVAAPVKRRKRQKYPGIPTVTVPPDDELGPCMLALTPMRRRFVLELAHGPSGYGSDIRAARAAGFGGDNDALRVQASRALHNPKVQDALREVGGKLIRASAFNAIRQTERIANDMEHRDCLKACLALMDRGGFAVETHHTVEVVHKSLDDQALEALRTMRALKATRDQLEDMFGKAEVFAPWRASCAGGVVWPQVQLARRHRSRGGA